MKTFLINVVIILACLICPTCCVVKNIQFDQQCAGYIKQAADANTVELALERLNMAINYVEKHNFTEGYTSVIWRTEDENIGFWYENLKACQHELQEGLNGTPLEKTNLLLKIRESLVDNHDGGITLTIPNGISVYPNNLLFGLWGWLSSLVILILVIWDIYKGLDY